MILTVTGCHNNHNTCDTTMNRGKKRNRSSLLLFSCSLFFGGCSAFIHPTAIPLKQQQQQQQQQNRPPTHLGVVKSPFQDQSSSSSAAESSETPLPTQQQQPLFPIEENIDNDIYDDGDSSSSSSGFYDIDYDDDDDVDVPYNVEVLGAQDNDNNIYSRDVDEMLTEREDRFYVNESGERIRIESCILVGVEDLSKKRRSKYSEIERENFFTLDESLVEMRELIKTAGLGLVAEMTQKLQEINPRAYIGTGKVAEAKELLERHDCHTIVFDAELSPGQQKSLENSFNKKLIQNDFLLADRDVFEIKVVDRTALILDIFAQHAKTREGKLQVDLALHEYRKPRLTKMWTHLERQSGAGGVGLRGPGESQLEIDKRLVRDRIITLKNKINDVQKQRSIHRRGRERTGLPLLSLVGYTNAGKSTLLNYLTRAGVMAESMLFATLDPTTRKVKLPGLKTSPEVLLTDTVGFIQSLPTQLIAAFRATLEEVREADVLLHVIDVSNPTWEKQEQSVLRLLNEILEEDDDDEYGDDSPKIRKPIVRVLNKVDLLDDDTAEQLEYEAAFSDLTVAVSSERGDGMTDLVAVIEEAMQSLLVPIRVEIPYAKSVEMNAIHEKGHVENIDYREAGTFVEARVPQSIANRLLSQHDIVRYNEDGTVATAVKKRKPKKKNRVVIDIQEEHTASLAADDDDEEEEEEEMDWEALAKGRHNSKKQ